MSTSVAAMDPAKASALAAKDPTLGAILGFLLGPFGYIYTADWMFFAISLITCNYFLLGFIIVPLHIYKKITAAKAQMGAS
ncbi:MAG: hypothetical protein JWM80_906 [Cyanobacteria bacterium RYN_339]|nr:hypothetical protein [Cyanobacteria bacterium RYN_339]